MKLIRVRSWKPDRADYYLNPEEIAAISLSADKSYTVIEMHTGTEYCTTCSPDEVAALCASEVSDADPS